MLNNKKLREMRRQGLFNNSYHQDPDCECMACHIYKLMYVPKTTTMGYVWATVVFLATLATLIWYCATFINIAHAMPYLTQPEAQQASHMRVVVTDKISGVMVDLKVIAKIESGLNPQAYNKHSHAVGMYQITPICLDDFNMFHKYGYLLTDMYDAQKAYIVAQWYFDFRIPQLLRHYGIADTIRNRIICWNAGIAYLTKHKRLPIETVNYINKYNRLIRSIN